MKTAILVSIAVAITVSALTGFVALAGEERISTLRSMPLDGAGAAPRLTNQINSDVRQVRNYPEQPPIIPHKTEDYQVDARINQCMECHSRRAIAESQAPMVSITHFMDRDGQFLASISPRRYFCNQCHVSQYDSKPKVENTFVDVEVLLKELK